MRSSLRWSIVSCLQLASYSAALPTIIGDLISQEPARSVILPRAGAQAATVPTTKLTGGLYWWVTANVNGQDVKVMVDTGSSDFWLQGTKAPSSRGDTRGAPLMQINGQKQNFDITYAAKPDAPTIGPVVSTKVKFGNVSVPDFGVGIATKEGFNYPLDGFMGLGFQGLNTVRPTQQPTFMEAVQQKLPQPIFTIGLKPNSHGTLNFGYVDKSLYQADLITASVDNSRSAWIVDSLTLSAGKATVTQQMLFDSGGADAMFADPTFVNNFWAQVSGSSNKSGSWTFPCSSKIPELQVGVGKAGSHAIAGTTFNAGPVKGVEGLCRGALQGASGIAGVPGLGSVAAPFFLTFFVVFNQAEPSISFAPQVQP